jgi:hypothetical protein
MRDRSATHWWLRLFVAALLLSAWVTVGLASGIAHADDPKSSGSDASSESSAGAAPKTPKTPKTPKAAKGDAPKGDAPKGDAPDTDPDP